MEYVEGENLQQMVTKRGEPFPEDQVLEWASQICDVLDYLHGQEPPVIYRDLKPSNIMIDTKDVLKLVDFGIARPYAEDSDNTHVVSGRILAARAVLGRRRSKIGHLCARCTMYFLLTGEEPLALQTSSPRKVNQHISESTDSNRSARDIPGCLGCAIRQRPR